MGPCKIFPKGNKKATSLILHCLAIADPAASWFEIVAIDNKAAVETANLIETAWLTKHPWPTQILLIVLGLLWA